MEPSIATFTEDKPLNPIVGQVMKVLDALKLLRIETDETGRVTSCTNFTILNLWLVWRGPLREDRLAMELLLMQAAVGVTGLWVRHELALLMFTVDNRF